MNCDGCSLAVMCGGEPEEFVKGLYVKYANLLAETMAVGVLSGSPTSVIPYAFLLGYIAHAFGEEGEAEVDMDIWGECFDAQDV